MSIIRVKKDSNYVVMNKTALNDERLSWKAKGIIAYLLSMPDDWIFYIDELVTHSSDGKTSFNSGFNELKNCGYVERRPVREGQRIKKWETIVHEIPINALQTGFQEVENLEVDKQKIGFQEIENQPLLNTDINQVINKVSINNTNVSENDSLIDSQFSELIKFYGLNIQKVSENIRNELTILINKYSYDLVFEAVKITARKKPNNSIKYIESILVNWKNDSITNINQLKERNVGKPSSKFNKKEIIPDWFYKTEPECVPDQIIDFEQERAKILAKLNGDI